MLKYIFTSSPRSGTKYIATVLSSLGIPCSHELHYGLPNSYWRPDAKIIAESSWLAAPFIHSVEGKVVHIIRNPIKVINSMMSDRALDGILGATLYNTWKMLVIPDLFKYKGLDRYLAFYIRWHKMIKSRGNNPDIYRLEDIINDPISWVKEVCPDEEIKPNNLKNNKENSHHNNSKYFKLNDFLKMKANHQLKKEFLNIYEKHYGKQKENSRDNKN